MTHATSIDLNQHLQRNPNTLATVLDDDLMMLDIDKGEYYQLDDIGAHIWNLLEQPLAVDNIIAGLLQTYNVDRDTCEADTLPYLEELLSMDIISKHK